MAGGQAWLRDYLAQRGDATKTAQGNTPAPTPQEPSKGVMSDMKNGTGIFTPGSSLAAALNNLLNPVRQADQVGVDAATGHPIRAAVGAAGLVLPGMSLAGKFGAPAADLTGEIAAHAAASPGYTFGRGALMAQDVAAAPRLPSAAPAIGPAASALPGTAGTAPAMQLTGKELKYVALLRNQGVQNPVEMALRDLRPGQPIPAGFQEPKSMFDILREHRVQREAADHLRKYGQNPIPMSQPGNTELNDLLFTAPDATR